MGGVVHDWGPKWVRGGDRGSSGGRRCTDSSPVSGANPPLCVGLNKARLGCGPTAGGARRAFSLLELVCALSVLILGLSGLLRLLLGDMALHDRARSVGIAMQSARQVMEQLAGLDPALAFASFNGTTADDPPGAPGPGFAVAGISADPADADGLCGEVVFPTPVGAPGVVTELGGAPFAGLPMDLNLDGDAVDNDVTAQLRWLPVIVRVRWRSSSGASESYELRTILS